MNFSSKKCNSSSILLLLQFVQVNDFLQHLLQEHGKTIKQPVLVAQGPVAINRAVSFMANTPEEFDWESFETKGFGEGYSKKKKEELAQMYENTLTTITEKEVVNRYCCRY